MQLGEVLTGQAGKLPLAECRCQVAVVIALVFPPRLLLRLRVQAHELDEQPAEGQFSPKLAAHFRRVVAASNRATDFQRLAAGLLDGHGRVAPQRHALGA